MSVVGLPSTSNPQNGEFSAIHGLREAIDELAEPTEYQAAFPGSPNSGRIICITSARDDASMKTLEDIFMTVMMQHNAQVSQFKDSLPLNKCHLVIINLFPVSVEPMITPRPLKDISPLLSTEIHSIRATQLADTLTHLILKHYDLASTTVTGIPMKEEQNASSSANYDVEIFHSKRAHSVILDSELLLPMSVKEGSEYDTVTLKWCTPRGCGSSEMQHCIAQHRVTPVDVTSRPSSCLINFLLNGRSVLLEMPRKSGGKLTSHLLSAHGGEIFIHTLSVSRSCLDDLPSISEGCGGRVVDYRIREFGQIMQQFKLLPKRPSPDVTYDDNLTALRRDLAKSTAYFPITMGSTIAYNLRHNLDTLLTNIAKPELTDDEAILCNQTIYQLVVLEERLEQLPLPNMGHRLKGAKKEEQYRLLWTELEVLAMLSGKTSILNCIRDCRSRNPAESADKGQNVAAEASKELETADSTSSSSLRKPMIRAITDSPMSPPLSGPLSSKKPKFGESRQNLLDMFCGSAKVQNQKRLDFSGRLCTPPNQIAKLYPNLGSKNASDSRPETDSK